MIVGIVAHAGWWTDRCQEKGIPFLVGLVALAASTLMFFVGTSILVLMAARALQGLSAALVWVSGLPLLTTSIKDGGIGNIMGYVTAGTALGELTGPLVGGIVYEHGDHWSICAVAMTVVGVDIVLRVFLRERNDQDEISMPDEQGPLLTEGHSHQIYDAPEDQHAAEETRTRHGRLAELESQQSLPPVSSFSNLLEDLNFLGSLFTVLVGSIIRSALDCALPLYTSDRFHFSTSYTGLVIVAFIVPNLAGPYIGDVAERHGPRIISIVSYSGLSTCFVVLALIKGQTTGSIIGFCITIFLSGVSESFLLTSHMVAISISAARISKTKGASSHGANVSAEGKVYACMNLAYGGGMLLGPLWTAGVLKSSGWRALCFSFTGLAAFSGALVGFRWRRWHELEIHRSE